MNETNQTTKKLSLDDLLKNHSDSDLVRTLLFGIKPKSSTESNTDTKEKINEDEND